MLRIRNALSRAPFHALALGSLLVLSSAQALADGHLSSSKDIIEVPADHEVVDADSVPSDSLKDLVEIVEPVSPWYVGLKGGVGFVQDTDFDTFGLSVANEYSSGSFLGSLSIGYDLKHGSPRGFRAELELGGSRASIDAHNFGGTVFDSDAAFGDTTQFYGFANLYYDIGFGGRYALYAGLGIGLSHVDFSNHGVDAVGTAMDDSSTGLAYQAMAGISYRMMDRMHVDLGYNYQAVTGVELTAVDDTESTIDLDTHAITIGLRFNL